MPSAWRIVKRRQARAAFAGEGARRYGGRWNSRGVPMVYLADSRALALLEILVHLEDDELEPGYVLFEIEYEQRDCLHLDSKRLPRAWRTSPSPRSLARIGDMWAERQGSLLLSVPSAILPEERVLLLSPGHPRFPALRIRGPNAIVLDPRLARRRA